MIILKNPVLFNQSFSSLSGSLKGLLSSAKWKSPALPPSRWCTNQWMVLDQSSNLENNLYCTCNPGQRHYDWKIELWELEYIDSHIQVVRLPFQRFDFSHCHQVAQVAFRAEVALNLVEVHPDLCDSSSSADSLGSHCGKDGSGPFDFHESLLCVFRLLPSPSQAEENQLLAGSLLWLWREVPWLVAAFPVTQNAKSLLWPFYSYSRQGAGRTVLAVPNLPSLP